MGRDFPLILAVIQGQQYGQIFVDQQEPPQSAVVITNFGFMCSLGTEQNDGFNASLAELLGNRGSLRPSYLLWYVPPTLWQDRLDNVTPSSAKRRERVRLTFRADRADYLVAPAQCPAGFELKNLDADLIPQTEQLGVKLESRFWASAADFSENSLGVCLVRGAEIVSLCYAAAIADGLAEIDVVTHPDYRGRGLGILVAQQFIRECLRRGIVPTWDCFVSNSASLKLAHRLGFIETLAYPLYSFNVPLKLVAGTADKP